MLFYNLCRARGRGERWRKCFSISIPSCAAHIKYVFCRGLIGYPVRSHHIISSRDKHCTAVIKKTAASRQCNVEILISNTIILRFAFAGIMTLLYWYLTTDSNVLQFRY